MIIWVKAQLALSNNRYQAVTGFLKHYDLDTIEMEDRYYQFVKRRNNLPFKIKQNEKNIP